VITENTHVITKCGKRGKFIDFPKKLVSEGVPEKI
jgi:hypothetical protein